jgi:hypothetical protein
MSISYMMADLSLEARQNLEYVIQAATDVANSIIIEDQERRQWEAQANEALRCYRSFTKAPYAEVAHARQGSLDFLNHLECLDFLQAMDFESIDSEASASSDETDMSQPYWSDSELMSSDEDYSEDESSYLDAAVVVGSEFEFAQLQREVDFFASTGCSPEIIQHIKPVPPKPRVSPKRKTPIMRKPPNSQNIELLDAFTPRNLTQDLLRCTNFPSPGPEYPEDYFYHLVGEYACAFRLQAISCRWSKMHIRDWNVEVDLLLHAIKNPGNGLTLWNVFDEALDDIKESMGNEGVVDIADGVTKREVTNKMKVAVAAKVKDL